MTKGTIITRATQIVNNTSLTSIADALFDFTLNRIYTDYEWDFLLKTANVSYAAAVGSAPLPTDYQKSFHLKRVDSSQSPAQEFNLEWMDYQEFIQIRDPSRQADYPQVWSVAPGMGLDSAGSTGDLLIYPTFKTGQTLRLHYYYLPADLATTASPAFRNHGFLVDVLVNELYRYMRDPRYDPLYLENMIKIVRRNTPDSGALHVRTIALDPKHHRRWGRFPGGS